MSAMPTTELGRTGLRVSKIGFGAMELRGPNGPWPRPVDDATASRLLNLVIDAGVNLIDTAPDYGLSESLIGKHISHRRDEFYLATKCGCTISPDGTPLESDAHRFDPPNLRAAVEQSLRRMNTDYVDLIQFHHSPSREVLDANDSVAELVALRDEGKVRFIGMSATLPNCYGHLEMDVFDAIQVPYSFLEREHEDFLSKAAAIGVGTIARNGVARGIVTADKDKIAGIPGGWREMWLKNRHRFEAAGLADVMNGATQTEFMIRYLLSKPAVNSTILGTASPDHMEDNIAAAGKGPLPEDILIEAQRRVAQVAAA
jgi:aryl-alcohol dehydrogenase-like predicted oxidoreductase